MPEIERNAPGEDGAAGAGEAPSGRILLEAQGIARSFGRTSVLSSVDLVLRSGESVVILGRRNSGKSVLSRILAGLVPADAGEIHAPEGIAPIVGVGLGLGLTGTLERDIGLRAAAYGLETRDLVDAVAGLLDDPGRLDQPFGKLDALNRTTIVYGASYLVPAGVYIADGGPFPALPGARELIEPLYADARERACVLSFLSSATSLRGIDPDRILLLEHGRLTPLGGIKEAIERFQPGRWRERRPVAEDPPTEFDEED